MTKRLTKLEEQLRLEDTGDTSHLYDEEEELDNQDEDWPSQQWLYDNLGIDITDHVRDNTE